MCRWPLRTCLFAPSITRVAKASPPFPSFPLPSSNLLLNIVEAPMQAGNQLISGEASEYKQDSLLENTIRVNSRSPPSKGVRGAASSVGPGPSRSARSTAAEKSRERKLRDDPLVILLSPQLVQCKRCYSKIKLSMKSSFDPVHWNKHRERCLKKPDAVVWETKEANMHQHRPTWPTEAKMDITRQLSNSPTPPLTPDNDGDSSMQSISSVKEESPPLPARPTLAAIRDPDPAFEEYLIRSHRRPTRDLSDYMLQGWQSWTWAQLKSPVFEHPRRDDNGVERTSQCPNEPCPPGPSAPHRAVFQESRERTT